MIENSYAWSRYFAENIVDPLEFPWGHEYLLSERERDLIASSIQEFQLGESSEGRSFVRRGEQHARRSGDNWFVPALRMFIAEEQRHSSWLGRFMDREGIRRLSAHWVDDVFRWLRNLAGLELSVTVLVTAECIAVPYYRALHDATASPLLRAICRRILREEAAHLDYQASTLAALGAGRSNWLVSLRYALHAALLTGTTAIVWHDHGPVFRAANYTWLRVWTEAFLELSRLEWRRAEAEVPNAAARQTVPLAANKNGAGPNGPAPRWLD